MKARTTAIMLLLVAALAGCKYKRLTDTQQFSL
jgi:hypothetical protein